VNRARSEFLSRVSHELRTPLNAILGFGQVLEVESLSERQRNSVEQIMKGGRHLLELVNDLLELARIESGKWRVSPAPLNIVDALNDIVLMIEPLAADRAVSICREIDAAAPIALADEQRVKQVLLNLISNAMKFSGEGKPIKVTVSPEKDSVLVSVADSGPGISIEDQEKLFQRFARIDTGPTRRPGSGLGLYLSKSIVDAHNGAIWIDSTPRKGATFNLRLPRKPS
jgi:signal transduction histidine kinase